MVKIQGEGGAGLGSAEVGIPSLAGAGAGLSLRCTRGEGALLNVESGGAHFRYCDRKTKSRLRKYMRANYRSWLDGYDGELTPDDLFLVTGTFMTGNWEAAAFTARSTSIGGYAGVEAMSAGGKILIDWRSRTLNSGGFISGHTHSGRDHAGHPLPNHNTVPSFGAVCHCDPNLENQCIFLRGWRIREMARFPALALVMPISAESMLSHNLRNIRFVKTTNSTGSSAATNTLMTSSPSPGTSPASTLPGPAADSPSSPPDLILEDADGTPADLGRFDHFDLLAIQNRQNGVMNDVMMIHDDDLIDFLHGADVQPTPLASSIVPETSSIRPHSGIANYIRSQNIAAHILRLELLNCGFSDLPPLPPASKGDELPEQSQENSESHLESSVKGVVVSDEAEKGEKGE